MTALEEGLAILTRAELAMSETQAAFDRFRLTAALTLRDAVDAFNASPVSVSSVDALRETVLRVADCLAPQTASNAVADALLADVVGVGRAHRASQLDRLAEVRQEILSGRRLDS